MATRCSFLIEPTATAYLGLGSNLGARRALLAQAAALLDETAGRVAALSAAVETEPWGYHSPNAFLNAALRLETSLSPLALLDATEQIERRLGRTAKSRDGRYADRPIDIDLLLYFDPDGRPVAVNDARLSLPHRHLMERAFVLRPLELIAPTLQLPPAGLTPREALARLEAAPPPAAE